MRVVQRLSILFACGGVLPAGGIPFPAYNYSDPHFLDSYYKAVTAKLNTTDAGSFQPSLDALDGLVQSLSVSP